MSTSTPSPQAKASHPQDAPPVDVRPAPTDSTPQGQLTRPGGHGRRHTWMMLLMCLPMAVLVAALVATGTLGGGAVLYAVGCMLMMAVMMVFMSGGHRH